MSLSSSKSTLDHLKPELRSFLSDVYPDWPQKGVNFRDIMPLFQHPDIMRKLTTAIADHCRALSKPIDVVAGLEARGFLFGPLVAVELNVPFVPIRKKGKLPGEVIAYSYMKEYGPDTLEIQKNAFKPGANVFVVDDLLATGGTMKSGIELIRAAGGQVAEAFCLIELIELKGKSVLDAPFYSVLEF